MKVYLKPTRSMEMSTAEYIEHRAELAGFSCLQDERTGSITLERDSKVYMFGYQFKAIGFIERQLVRLTERVGMYAPLVNK